MELHAFDRMLAVTQTHHDAVVRPEDIDLEIAALAGFCVEGAASGVPVIVDGVIACAALLVAEALAPGVAARCVAGHRPVEPVGVATTTASAA